MSLPAVPAHSSTFCAVRPPRQGRSPARTAALAEDGCHRVRVERAWTRRAQVKKLVDSAYERASGILRRNEAELHTLAQALLDKETLSGTQARRPAAARLL